MDGTLDMKREVYWKNPRHRSLPALEGDIAARFLVVGGGIAGLMTVHALLARRVSPREIVLIEAEEIGSGSTGRSAGILVAEPENEANVWWDALERKYGRRLIGRYQKAHLTALHTLKQLIVRGSIHCEAETRSMLVLARDAAAAKVLARDHEARRRAGIKTALLSGKSYASEFGGSGFIAAERDVQGLSVNPLALAQGIADYLRRKGVRVFENTALVSMRRGIGTTPRGAVEYQYVVLARGMGESRLKLNRFVTTIVLTELLARAELARLRLEDGDMFNDGIGKHPFHYGKVTKDKRLLLGFGDSATDATISKAKLCMSHVRDIRRFLKRVFPEVPMRLAYAWSGGYAISGGLVPRVRVRGNCAEINGAGIQLSSIVAADYAATKLLGKSHELDGLWTS